MGLFYAQGPDGSSYQFKIAGDQPSPTEAQRIDQFFSGKSAPGAESPSLGGVIGGGIRSFFDTTQAGLYTAGQGLANIDGDFLGKTPGEWEALAKGEREEAAGRTGMVGGVFDQEGVGGTAKYLTGVAAQSGLPTLAALGLMATGVGAIPAGAIAGAMYLPTFLNENAEAQIKQHGHVKNWSNVVGASGAQAAVEGITDSLTFGIAGLGKKALSATVKSAIKEGTLNGLTKAVNEIGKTAYGTVGKRIGIAASFGMATEGLEEGLQTIITRAQAEMPLTDPEAVCMAQLLVVSVGRQRLARMRGGKLPSRSLTLRAIPLAGMLPSFPLPTRMCGTHSWGSRELRRILKKQETLYSHFLLRHLKARGSEGVKRIKPVRASPMKSTPAHLT
jgi:hypothetical protein